MVPGDATRMVTRGAARAEGGVKKGMTLNTETGGQDVGDVGDAAGMDGGWRRAEQTYTSDCEHRQKQRQHDPTRMVAGWPESALR